MGFLSRQKRTANAALRFVALLACSVQGQTPVTGGDSSEAIESVRAPLISAASQEFPGDSAAKDFFVRLPEHIDFRGTNELRLALYPSLEVLSHLCTITASINGDRLAGAQVEGKSLRDISDLAIRVRFPVPDRRLVHGWNRLTIGFVLKRPPGESGTARQPGTWTIRKSDSYLSISYRRAPMFPELPRFPGSFAEEKLLHASPDNADSQTPTLALLLPAQMRDVHLRACAVIGARLGQLGYLAAEDCRIEWIDDRQDDMAGRNGIIVALRDELGSLSLPQDLADKARSLGAGQGLIAEFIQGTTPRQRRRLLVTGADDGGLEKAVLTLGDAPALAATPPNPAVIDAMPSVQPDLEAMTQPGASRLFLRDLGAPEIRLNGIHVIQQSLSGWRLPPGFDLSSGVLGLHFSHSATISPGSSLEVLVNGTEAGTVDLTEKNAVAGTDTVTLPNGLSGRDPMILAFRANLDVPPVDCGARKEDEPWVLISGDSSMNATPALAQVQGVGRTSRLLLRDNFLRNAALLVPSNLSPDEVRWLFEFSMSLGKNLPSSPILWPEVCSYSPLVSPPLTRLRNRSVLLLGSVGQWSAALPPGAPVLVKTTDAQNGSVRIQGREANIASFEPSLAFMQMMGSPWSPGERLVVAGGWQGFATPALMRMLADSDIAADLTGNVCAMDANGRVASYDTRRPARDSFAERIQSRIPAGMSVSETRERVTAQQDFMRREGRINTTVFYICAVLFALIVGCRLLFMWERARLLKETAREQSSPEHVS